MEITIREDLVSALEREAKIANYTNEEYVEMIINSNLVDKRKQRLLSDMEFVGIENIKDGVDTLRIAKEEVQKIELEQIELEQIEVQKIELEQIELENKLQEDIIK